MVIECIDQEIKTCNAREVIMDGVIISIEKRFLSNSKRYADLSLLSLNKFNDIKNGLPALDVFVSKLIKFDTEVITVKLRTDLIHFSNNIKKKIF